MIQPRRQELPSSKGEEVSNHNHEDCGLNTDIAVRIQQVRETSRLLRYRCEDDHSIQEADDHPADLVIGRCSACVPSE